MDMRAHLILVTALAAVPACSNRPTPTAPDAQAPFPRSVAVVGAEGVPLGETTSFALMATMSDGSTRDVSSEALWSTSNERALVASGGGRFTAPAVGDAVVRALWTLSASKSVVVVPRGLFKLSGTVRDGLWPVSDARVDVSWEGGQLSARTSSAGRFALYGVGRTVDVRVAKEGFAPFAIVLTLDDNRRDLAVALNYTLPRLEMTGIHRLTIDGSQCAVTGAFPDDLRTRTYIASIRQQPDGFLGVSLSGASFAATPATCATCTRAGDFFRGYSSYEGARFNLEPGDPGHFLDDDAHPPSVTEEVPGGYLGVIGTVSVTAHPGGVSGSLDGSIGIFDRGTILGGEPRARCHSPSVTFTRLP